MKGSYEGGELDGLWQYFDESGTLSMELEYNLGEIVRVNGVKMKVPQPHDEN
jgi:antitoxin component YwqK of YwqJK toxin-antitoxin module